jgi:hypothetical protein
MHLSNGPTIQWAGQRLLLRIHIKLYAPDENIIPVAHHACLFKLTYIIKVPKKRQVAAKA